MGVRTLLRVLKSGLKFRHFCVLISAVLTAFLFLSIVSLFLFPKVPAIVECLKSKEIIYSIKLSVLTSAISTFLVMSTAIPVAYSLARYAFPGKSLVKSVIDLPIAFPELVLGLCLLIFLGNYLKAGIVFTKPAIVVAQYFTAFPYAARILYSTFENIDERLEFASRSLGYGEFETFAKVTIPMAREGIFASSIISFSRCMGTFGAVLVLAGGMYMNTETLPITLYLNLSYGNLNMAVTSGIVLIILSFVAIFVFEVLDSRKASERTGAGGWS